MALLREIEPVAVLMTVHKGAHISLIVTEVQRCGTLVERREVIPVPGRPPGRVAGSVEVVEDRGPGHEYRIEVIIGTIDIRCSDDLDIYRLGSRGFCHDCGDVLIEICPKHCLDDKHVGVVLDSLDNPQVINIAVSVQVQIGYDV